MESIDEFRLLDSVGISRRIESLLVLKFKPLLMSILLFSSIIRLLDLGVLFSFEESKKWSLVLEPLLLPLVVLQFAIETFTSNLLFEVVLPGLGVW
jgi:hypothetical protein